MIAGESFVKTPAFLSSVIFAAVWSGLAVTPGVSALELFVDQRHTSACNTNAGTEAAPFKTIQPAVDAAQPGDTIWVKAGDYEDKVYPNREDHDEKDHGAGWRAAGNGPHPRLPE